MASFMEPYENPFDAISVTVSVIAFVIHIIMLLILGTLAMRASRHMMNDIGKTKMKIISTAFFALGIGDAFYLMMFLTLVLAGTTGYSVAIGSVEIYLCSVFETVFRIFAVVFLVGIYSYSVINEKGMNKKVYGMWIVGLITIILQLFPQNYFGFKVHGDVLYLRPVSDIAIVVVALIAMGQSLITYLRTRRMTKDPLVKRRKLGFSGCPH